MQDPEVSKIEKAGFEMPPDGIVTRRIKAECRVRPARKFRCRSGRRCVQLASARADPDRFARLAGGRCAVPTCRFNIDNKYFVERSCHNSTSIQIQVLIVVFDQEMKFFICIHPWLFSVFRNQKETAFASSCGIATNTCTPTSLGLVESLVTSLCDS